VRVSAELGDITTVPTDAIVNAANSTLLGGGGVDGAIHRAAGPGLLASCKEVRRSQYPDGLPVGAAVATPAHDLPSRWVIHTVGPNWHYNQRDPLDLASCFTSSLDVADSVGARSIAFPAVSAGVYGWDPAVVAKTAVDAVHRWSEQHPDTSVDDVRFILFSPEIHSAFDSAISS